MQFSRRSILAALTATPFAFVATKSRAETHDVAIQGFSFAPHVLEISAGDTVVFQNFDNAPHTATSLDGAFDTGTLGTAERTEVIVETAGSFEYRCQFHPSMKGIIVAN